jgi:signal peptidase I
MAPTLLPGDCLYVDPRAYRERPPAPGEIVVTRDPTLPSRHLVKRIGFVAGGPPPPDGSAVPPGSVYLVGDNPVSSRDSREFGPVPVRLIVGRAYRCYRPPEHRRDL